ncbi:MAG: class I SAM-dependent methyltransferase, partial [Gammaproteobacteria bacterium]|nr:class I SAM-dependent methyltransferase [Gammaproteobacteria bacterium]
MGGEFKDHFSGHARDYALYRPDYPGALYQFLLEETSGNACAWDCGTGNGQVACALQPHFKKVIATDASIEQISAASRKDGIEYRVCLAESSGIKESSVDLITVAQALHWFDFDAFYSEAKRVLKPSGVIAVWTYGLHQISNDVDPISERFYKDIVGEFWPPERRFVEEGYSSIPFPFDELSVPGFEMSVNWDFHQY